MECSHNTLQILLAEDDSEMRTTLASVLRANGYQVVECSDGLDLLKTFASHLHQTHAPYYSLVISDIRMPGLSGMEFLEGFRGKRGFPPVILITAFGDEETHFKARESGAVALLDKPFEVEDLLAMVRKIVDQSARTRHVKLTDECDHRKSPLIHGKAASPG